MPCWTYIVKNTLFRRINWDRCDFIEHGEKMPKELTDVDKKTGADVNAGLLLVKPDKREYNKMINEIAFPNKTMDG